MAPPWFFWSFGMYLTLNDPSFHGELGVILAQWCGAHWTPHSESHLYRICSVLDVLILQCFLHACINCSVSDQLFSVQDWYSSLKSAQEKHPIRWGVGRIDQTNMTMKPTVAQPVSINADGNNLGVQQES